MSSRAPDIRERAFRFACDVAKAATPLASAPPSRHVADQLLKSATGIGANLEEAKAGSSRREFVRFVEIALRETLYWLRITGALGLGERDQIEALRGEADQIVRILTAIVVNTKKRMPHAR
jgi:four helix bundle protein